MEVSTFLHSGSSRCMPIIPTRWGGSATDDPRFSTDPAPTLLPVSDYEWLVKLAAKGLAERDNHLMPKSVTTPEEFYEGMARAALDAIGLHALLEELTEALQELKNADERANLAVNADVVARLPEGQSVAPQHVPSLPPVTRIGYEKGVPPAPSRRGQGTRKAENARLRR
jgi:hypothetical protein